MCPHVAGFEFLEEPSDALSGIVQFGITAFAQTDEDPRLWMWRLFWGQE